MANLILPRRLTDGNAPSRVLGINARWRDNVLAAYSGGLVNYDQATGRVATSAETRGQAGFGFHPIVGASYSAPTVIHQAITVPAQVGMLLVVRRTGNNAVVSTQPFFGHVTAVSYVYTPAIIFSGSDNNLNVVRSGYGYSTINSWTIEELPLNETRFIYLGFTGTTVATDPIVVINGQVVGTTKTGTATQNVGAYATPIYINRDDGGAERNVLFGLGAYLKNPSVEQGIALTQDPWQIFRAKPRVLYFDVAGGGATGTGTLTTTAVTASGSGVISHTGTGALSTNVATASGTGVLSHTGTGALTTLVTTLAGAGVLTHVGTGALTTSATTLSGEGTVSAVGAVTGTGALTTSAVTASGSGVLSHTGTGALSTSVVTLDGAGVLTHTGTGALTTGATTADGTGTVLGTITGTGALTTNKITLYGYDVLPVAVTPVGGGKGSVSKPAKRQRLIIVEQIDDVEELVEQVQEIIKTEPRKKLANKVKKPTVSLQESPQAAFDWIGYYQAQLDALRDQQRAESIKQQLARNAQIIQAILENQANNAILAAQEAEYARLREEEDFLLLLMAA